MTQLVFNGLVTGSIYSIIAVGLVLIYRTLGIINFFHSTMYMLGALTGYKLYCELQLPILIVFPVCLLAVGLLGAVIERIVLRPLSTGVQTRIVIGTVIIGDTIINNLALPIIGPYAVRFESYLPGISFNVGPLRIQDQQILIVIVSVALGILLTIFFRSTRMGKTFRAMASNPKAALLMGVNVSHMRMATFGLASGIGALAGLLVGPMYIVSSTMGDTMLLKAFVVAVLGGLDSMVGAIVGGLIIGVVDSLTGYFFGTNIQDIWGFLIMALMLMFRPNGLFGKNTTEKV